MLQELLNNATKVLDGLQGGETIRNVVTRHGDDIMEMQLQQLFSGKASSGEDIRPFYSEDLQPGGYFKSADSAKRYSGWKQTLNYPMQANRNPDAPNLYVNGKFHSELGVNFGSDAVSVGGKTSYADNIVAKYGIGTFGLTDDNWDNVFWERGGYDELLQEVKKQLFAS